MPFPDTLDPVLDRDYAAAVDATALDHFVLATGDTVSIQDAARLTGVSPHTLRWYERVGLVRGVDRGPTGRRCYTSDHLRWIVMLRALRATGMPVATLRELTDQFFGGNGAAPVDIVRLHRASVLALMTMLHRGLHVLDHVERALHADHGAREAVPTR